MSAALRCCCGRCHGGVTYTSAVDWLSTHQLSPHEFILDQEVSVVLDHPRGELVVRHAPTPSIFATTSSTTDLEDDYL